MPKQRDDNPKAKPAGSDEILATMLAAAEELSSFGFFGRRFARSLRVTAGQLESGRSLEQIAADPALRLSQSFRGVLQMGLAVDDFPVVLTELTEHQMQLAELKRELVLGLVYPAIVLVMVIIISVFFGQTVIPVMVETVTELELTEASLTRLMDFGGRVSTTAAAAVCVGALATIGLTLRWVGGAARFRWLMGTLPLLGGVIRNLGAVDLAGMLRIMLARRLPLDRALSLVGVGAGDPNAAAVALQLSQGVAAGQQMSQLLNKSTRMPTTMVPLVDWGERHDAMDQAMTIIVDTFTQRIRMQTDWIIAILPPIVYALAGAVLVVIVGLLADSYNELLNMFWFGL